MSHWGYYCTAAWGTKTLSESKHFGKRKQGSLGDENMRPISKYRMKVTEFAGLFPNWACIRHSQGRVAKALRTKLWDKPPSMLQTNLWMAQTRSRPKEHSRHFTTEQTLYIENESELWSPVKTNTKIQHSPEDFNRIQSFVTQCSKCLGL